MSFLKVYEKTTARGATLQYTFIRRRARMPILRYNRGTTPFRSKARWVKLLISLERHFRNLDRVEDPKRFH